MFAAVLRKITKIVFAVVGGLLLITGLVGVVIADRGLGIWMTFGLGVLFVGCGLCPDNALGRIPLWIRFAVCGVTAVLLGLYVFLFVFGRMDNLTYTEDAVIVLGCGLRDDEPSTSLKQRLNKAIDYHRKNPDALIVVSGGKGDDEAVSEALAMERYLTANGVPMTSILKEYLSTSTAENFAFSKNLLDSRFEADYRIAYISNDYHIYRAGLIAHEAGYPDATHGYAPTLWPSMIIGGLRECMAVTAQWLHL